MATTLLYLKDMCQLQCEAHIIQTIDEENLLKIVVDQTVFYPQGGGQPSDVGAIKNHRTLFEVQGVFLENGIAFHKGVFKEGNFEKGELVSLEVNAELRNVHNKNHTAGHLIDYALYNLGYKLTPSKAYHFPQGPYVEYHGTLEQPEREKLQPLLEQEVHNLIEQGLPVTISLIDNDPHKRAMAVNDYPPILCGGTHVLNTQEIGNIVIRKIKNEKGNLRVSYAVT